MATGVLAGVKNGQSWSVAFTEAEVLASFDYAERVVELNCEGPFTAQGEGTIQGGAIGQIDGSLVTGVQFDFTFEWLRRNLGNGGGNSAFEISILADVTLIPQDVVVLSSVQLVPTEASPSNGEIIGRSDRWFGPNVCEDGSAKMLTFAAVGDFVPVDPDPLACLKSYGDPEYPVEVECLPFAPELANLLVKSDPNVEELGDEYYWYCEVKPNAYATQTTGNGTTYYGWRASGRVWCDEAVLELGVTIQWDEEVNDTGVCLPSQLVHELANEPHEVEDSLNEVTQAVEDPDKAKCVVYYKKSDWVCPSDCDTITIQGIRFTIVFPYEVTNVDYSSTTITAKPVEGQEDYCYKSPNDHFSVECHFEFIELVRID